MSTEDLLEWMSNNDEFFVKECAQNGIEQMMIFSFVCVIIFYLGMQWWFMRLCTNLAKNQKILEDKYMGPEII
jgi:hypothetical protein